MRRHLSAFRPLLAASVLLCAAVAAGELTLRLMHNGSAGDLGDFDCLTEASETAYRQLRRLSVVSTASPDSGEEVSLSFNSHGLRGPEIVVPKPAGVYRVLCLGDETFLGPHVAESDSVPARLQHLLQQHSTLTVEVLNAGVPGECPLLSWLRLRHSLIGLQPDLIVMHVDMSDIADDHRCRRETRLDSAGMPVACPHPSTQEPSTHRPFWRNLHLVQWLVHSFASMQEQQAVNESCEAPAAWMRDHPADWELYVQQALAPLENLQKAAGGIGATFVISTSPQPWQVSADASAGPGVREAAGVAPGLIIESRVPFKTITNFAHRRGILCCDASRAFQSVPDPSPLFFRNAPQLSTTGNELYARVLCQFLVTNLSRSPSAGQSVPAHTQTPTEESAEPSRPEGITISFDGSE